METEDLQRRFAYHPPRDNVVRDRHEMVRGGCMELAAWMNNQLPEGREKALAITALEEAMMWANAAIARNQGN